jgi:hypothetical protein
VFPPVVSVKEDVPDTSHLKLDGFEVDEAGALTVVPESA